MWTVTYDDGKTEQMNNDEVCRHHYSGVRFSAGEKEMIEGFFDKEGLASFYSTWEENWCYGAYRYKCLTTIIG